MAKSFDNSGICLMENLKSNQQIKMHTNRKPLKKDENEDIPMTKENVIIALNNQQKSFATPQLNEVIHLQYYGFGNIANLDDFLNLNTVYGNNNTIERIENLSHLKHLVFLNLANNRIEKMQNLQFLPELKVLDLSHNKLRKVEKLGICPKIETLCLNSNFLTDAESLQDLSQSISVSSLNLTDNPIDPNPQIFKILGKMPALTVLYMRSTPFCRGVSSYRKETIFNLEHLLFLDDKSVTPDERIIVKAWKDGGLIAEREARKGIAVSKEEERHKIYDQICERNLYVQQLREKLFNKLTRNQQIQVEMLEDKKISEKEKLSLEQFDTVCVQLQELRKYLDLMREEVKYMSVEELPKQAKMLIQKETPDAIYVYNIREEDLPIIKEKFFKDQTKPIIAKSYVNSVQRRWVQEYDEILTKVYEENQENPERFVALFNMKLYDFDQLMRRNLKRFSLEELMEKVNPSAPKEVHEFDQLD